MMAQAETCGKDTKDQKRLRRGLIFDVVGNGVGQQQRSLKVHLRQEQSQQDQGPDWFVNGVQEPGHTQLSQGDRCRANPFGSIDTECYREGIQAHRSVAFNRLEVIYNGNTKSRNGIQNGPEQGQNQMKG